MPCKLELRSDDKDTQESNAGLMKLVQFIEFKYRDDRIRTTSIGAPKALLRELSLAILRE